MKMKKIYLGLMLLGSLFTSCDMDVKPEGSIMLDEGIQTINDALAERNGLYSFMRSRCGGSYVVTSDLQTDLFLGTMQNGNAYQSFVTGNILSNDRDIEGVWSGLLSGIMQVNYFLEESERFLNTPELDDKTIATVNHYRAEAYFFRAYFNYQLMNYFCEAYDASKASAPASGIPLCTRYQPSSDRGSYPGRSTLAETYTAIENDLAAALTGIEEFETTDKSYLVPTGNGFLNSYAVKALQARVALLKKDWNTAKTLSQEIINFGKFPLTNINDFASMWTNDEGDEIIFQPYGDASQRDAVPATGSLFCSLQPVNVKFTPSAAVLDVYSDDDIRGYVYLEALRITYNGATFYSPNFNKYPGNPVLDSGSISAQKNLPKPFRTAEQYLILAEASLELGDTETANNALNTLRDARIADYTPQNYTGNVLRDQIRLERVKELIGEGFRLSDLRRWNLGFTRDGNYGSGFPGMDGFIIALGTQVVYTPGDYRYTWPIPSAEMETNPQLAGQQNPGY